ncbi:hypothetical protein K503DRAFT_866891 [Rhizopogon vinicolor AM-OR11-026]|uniref:Uncharacterized protein n=1 Tax=Rhizopogon vinicolor AM-OR11-026 TaxID=1314800 RepID=A0A1B7MXQ0_9AGAM|nr:hypothetical protein K503DRAFT_866891 [Rhizopogon vinicolor AM-OR11-026]
MANDPCNKGDSNFGFAPRQPNRCHGRQHASTVQNRLSLDHILSRLKSALKTSREAGAKLISLSMSKNDIRNTFGAPKVRPLSFLYALLLLQGFPHFPQPILPLCTVTTNLEHISALKYIFPFPLELPALSSTSALLIHSDAEPYPRTSYRRTVRQTQIFVATNDIRDTLSGVPVRPLCLASCTWTQQLSSTSAALPAPMPVPFTIVEPPAPSPVHFAFSELRHTTASLASDADKVRPLEDMIPEYDTEVVALRNFIHALSLRTQPHSGMDSRMAIVTKDQMALDIVYVGDTSVQPSDFPLIHPTNTDEAQIAARVCCRPNIRLYSSLPQSSPLHFCIYKW